MKIRLGLTLILIVSSALVVIATTLVGSFGMCDSCGSNYPSYAAWDESYWWAEAYYFTNFNCDNLNSAYGTRGNASLLNQTIDNHNAQYWLNNARDLYMEGLYDQAASSYTNAAKLDPSINYRWLSMGNSPSFWQETMNRWTPPIP